MAITTTMTNAIEKNWDEIKKEIGRNWRKIKPKDLETIDGSYTALIDKIKEVYHYDDEEMTERMKEFLDDLDIETIENLRNTFYKNVALAASKAKEVAEESWQEIKDKSQYAIDYATENPIKIGMIGIGLGILLAKFCSSKD